MKIERPYSVFEWFIGTLALQTNPPCIASMRSEPTMYPQSMQVTFNIPDDLALQVVTSGKDASRAALEALAVESYRSGLLTESEVRRMLGYETRMEVHALLAEHDVCLNYSVEHLQQDIAASDKLRAIRTSHPANAR